MTSSLSISIPSSDLPKLDAEVKSSVNEGIVSLYRISSEKVKEAHYLIKVRDYSALLDAEGEILQRYNEEEMTFERFVYFSDLPFPETSNSILYASAY